MATHHGFRPTNNSPTIARSFSAGVDIAEFKAKYNPNKKFGADNHLYLNFQKDLYVSKNKLLSFDDTFFHYRNSFATMTDSDGVVKWAGYNYFEYSTDLTQLGQTRASTVQDGVDPFGIPAFTITEDTTASNSHGIGQSNIATNGQTWEFHAKANGRNHVRVISTNSGADGATFELIGNGAVTIHGPSEITEATITPISDGWYHCLVTSTTSNDISIFTSTDLSGTYIYDGDGVSGIKVSANRMYFKTYLGLSGMAENPQYAGTLAATYWPNPGGSLIRYARKNHHEWNGSEYTNKGLWLEGESATNIHTESIPTTGTWSTRTGGTMTVDVASSPIGANTAALFTEDTSTGEHSQRPEYVTLTAGNRYVYSIFMKSNGRNILRFTAGTSRMYGTIGNSSNWKVDVDLNAGTCESSDSSTDVGIENFSDGWHRVHFAFDAQTTGVMAFRMATDDGSGTYSYTGDGSSGFYFTGGQCESTGATGGLYQTYPKTAPSSYIPCSGATATRVAETFYVNSDNVPWSSSAMSFLMKADVSFADSSSTSEVDLFGYYQSADDAILVNVSTDGTDTGRIRVHGESGTNVTTALSANTDQYTPGYKVPVEFGVRYNTSVTQAISSGEAGAEETTLGGSIYANSIRQLYIGGNGSTYNFNGNVKEFSMWDKDVGGMIQAETWHPTSLFANSEVGFIWDLSDRETVFSDAGTTAAAANDNIEYITDLSPNGYNGTQTTESFGPLYVQDAAGNWGMKFDGIDDHLDVTAMPVIKTFCVAYKLGDGETQGIFYYRGSGDFVGAFDDNSDVTTSNDYGTSSLRVNGKDLSVLTRGELYTALASGKNKNSVLLSEHTGAAGTGVASVGFYGGGYVLTGTIYAMVAIDRYLTDQEKLNLETWVSNRSSARMYTGI